MQISQVESNFYCSTKSSCSKELVKKLNSHVFCSKVLLIMIVSWPFDRGFVYSIVLSTDNIVRKLAT